MHENIGCLLFVNASADMCLILCVATSAPLQPESKDATELPMNRGLSSGGCCSKETFSCCLEDYTRCFGSSVNC